MDETNEKALTPPPDERAPQRKKEKTGNFQDTIVVVLSMCVLLIGTVSLFVGICEISGKTLDILFAVNCVYKVLKISSATIYDTLAYAAIGIYYFVIIIFGIKACIASIKPLIAFFSKTDAGNKQRKLEILYNYNLDIALSIFTFLMTAHMLVGITLTTWTYALVISVVISYVFTGLVVRIRKPAENRKDKKVSDVVFSVLRSICMISLILIMVINLYSPALWNISFGLRALFDSNFGSGGFLGGVYTFYEMLLKHALIMTAMFYFNRSIRNILTDVGFYKDYEESSASEVTHCGIIILVLIGISACIGFFIPLIMENVVAITYSTVERFFVVLCKDFLPVILICIAMIILGKTDKC